MRRPPSRGEPGAQERLSPKDWISKTGPLLAKLARHIQKTVDCLDCFFRGGIYYFENVDDRGECHINSMFTSCNALVELDGDLQHIQAHCSQFVQEVRACRGRQPPPAQKR